LQLDSFPASDARLVPSFRYSRCPCTGRAGEITRAARHPIFDKLLSL
jgi:hypothetical protein